MSGKNKSKRVAKCAPLPKYIRQELRTTCALKGYSDLKASNLVSRDVYMNNFIGEVWKCKCILLVTHF